MLRKILDSINRIGRNWSYFAICLIIAISINLVNLYPLKTQTVNSTTVPETYVDWIEFSSMIAKIESKWERDYENYFHRDFSNHSRSAKQIAKHLTEISQQTDTKPAIIWAIPQEDLLRLLLITPNGRFVVKEIRGANRERLSKRVAELNEAIFDRPSLKYMPSARILYQWLFRPLDPYLEAEEIDTLMLCTGPSLRSLPFAALHDGEKFMIEKYSLTRIPAFNLTDTDYEAKQEQTVLAMGTSEFEDLPSLPGVDIEISTIVPKLWSGKKMVNREFTIPNLIQSHQQGDFDIIHIASHALFSPGSPEYSYIQFSDRKLSLDQLADLELEDPTVDLLVLSACETALGDKDAEFGFAGLAIQAGVKSALATLWTINDAGTVVLMSEFYQQLRNTNIKAEALRNAQIRLLNREVFLEGSRVRGSTVGVDLPTMENMATSLDFNHPYYWAGFTIIGNPW